VLYISCGGGFGRHYPHVTCAQGHTQFSLPDCRTQDLPSQHLPWPSPGTLSPILQYNADVPDISTASSGPFRVARGCYISAVVGDLVDNLRSVAIKHKFKKV
jgi:hypothetical protein